MLSNTIDSVFKPHGQIFVWHAPYTPLPASDRQVYVYSTWLTGQGEQLKCSCPVRVLYHIGISEKRLYIRGGGGYTSLLILYPNTVSFCFGKCEILTMVYLQFVQCSMSFLVQCRGWGVVQTMVVRTYYIIRTSFPPPHARHTSAAAAAAVYNKYHTYIRRSCTSTSIVFLKNTTRAFISKAQHR